MPRSVSASIGLRTFPRLLCDASVQFKLKIIKIFCRRSRSPKYPEPDHFTLLICRGRLRNYNACEQLLFCSLNLSVSALLLAVPVVICLRSQHDICFNDTIRVIIVTTWIVVVMQFTLCNIKHRTNISSQSLTDPFTIPIRETSLQRPSLLKGET